ncbi:hypothetical protein J2S47_003298 [Streptomyces griseoviridis]|uniref:Uncharacterized protein n=1 Tax=Streptomyces griseoviridis TaxID=45398 RepID=A0ABT9LGG2_STRGD|nr:hypothetical protein [Streptomyces griseoviridis]
MLWTAARQPHPGVVRSGRPSPPTAWPWPPSPPPSSPACARGPWPVTQDP